MKKIYSFLSLISICSACYAGTPVIDGTINVGEGWGTAVAVADGTAGWSNANAKKLYVTYDNSYVYFGAEVTAESWQQFVFAVNTKAGGSSVDSWGRTITYAQTNPPDYLFRGDIAGSNYAEYHTWNGTSWTGTGTNINAAGTEVKGVFVANNGFIEIRVSRSTLTNWPVNGDVEFIITGNNSGAASGHGCFDAIPNDNNCTGWNAPQNASVVTNYVSNVVLPLQLQAFNAKAENNNVLLQWKTLNEAGAKYFDIEQSFNGAEWTKIKTVLAKNIIVGSNYTTEVSMTGRKTFYRLKMVLQDEKYSYSPVVMFKQNNSYNFELLGTIIRDVARVSINGNEDVIYASLSTLSGQLIQSSRYQHPGGSSTMQLQTANLSPGMYVLKVTGSEQSLTFKIIIQ